jgi:hypothetical protein
MACYDVRRETVPDRKTTHMNDIEPTVPDDRDDEPRYGLPIWGVIVAVSTIYLIAFPIRIQYWVVRLIGDDLYKVEDRKWMPVREVWWTFIRDAPDFGPRILVQAIVVVAAIGTFAASLWLLRLILTQSPEQGVDA